MNRKWLKLGVLLAFLLALAIRLLSYSRVFGSNYTAFLDPDSYYHMRGIFYTVQHFPKGLIYDSYVNYPYGWSYIWSPFFDQVAAFFILIAGMGNPSISTIETVAAFFPAVIGALTIIPLYFLVKNIFDEYAGLFSAFLLAIMSAHIFKTLLGYTDHHGLNSLLSIIIYTFFILALIKSKEPSGEYKKYALLAGIAGGVVLFAWAGAQIYLLPIGIYGFLQSIINQKNKKTSRYLSNIGIIIFFSALLTALPMIYATYGNLERVDTQLFLTFALLMEFTVIGLLSNIIRRKQMNWKIYPVAFAGIILIAALLFPQILSGIPYIIKQDIVLTTIEETQSIFAIEGLTFAAPWNLFHYAFFTAILAFAMLAYRYLRSRDSSVDLFILLWFLYALALSYYQIRFSIELAFPIAALNGFLFSTVKELVKTISFECSEAFNASIRYILLGIFVLSITISSVSDINAIKTEPRLVDPKDYYDAWVWMKENTPKTSYYTEPVQQPEYGVMSYWWNGNGIIYYAQRPAVSNNFQTGIVDSSKFFTETSEDNANELLEKLNVRYIFSTSIDHGTYRNMLLIAEGAEKQSLYNSFPLNHYYKSMLIRLHLADGMTITKSGITNPSLQHYRLVYESKTSIGMEGISVKQAKVFEFVKGANISGIAPAGNITISTRIKTNQGRTFWYNQSAISSGEYNFTVPYSMDAPYETRAIAPYTISINNLTKTVYVTDQDIMQGRRLVVDFERTGDT